MALADELLAVLDDPTHMWTHALRELSSDARRLFLTLTLLPKPVSSDVLQIAYSSQTPNQSESFLDSLRSLEDSFVSIEKIYANVRSVSFRNPSLEDFANAYLNDNLDWLDVILSNPKFYEQVANIFRLAMAHEQRLAKVGNTSRVDRIARHPDVKRWVDQQAASLIGTAAKLLDSKRAELYYLERSRLGQLLEIMDTYGLASDVDTLEKLRHAATVAACPDNENAADAILDLLNIQSYREMLDEVLQGDTAVMAREYILDKDSWKFRILADLDGMLNLDSMESLDSWGNDYVEYTHQMVDHFVNSSDYDDIQSAISELNNIGTMLGVDFDDEIAALDNRRRHLPQDRDYDDEDDANTQQTDGSSDASAQLDSIFGSLLDNI